ncbi:hypothetical protein D3C73_1318600 [compost metagenome]
MTLSQHQQLDEEVCVALSKVVEFPLEIVGQRSRGSCPIIFPQAGDEVLPKRIVLTEPVKGDFPHPYGSPGVSQHTGEKRQHCIRPDINQRDTCIV